MATSPYRNKTTDIYLNNLYKYDMNDNNDDIIMKYRLLDSEILVSSSIIRFLPPIVHIPLFIGPSASVLRLQLPSDLAL